MTALPFERCYCACVLCKYGIHGECGLSGACSINKGEEQHENAH